MAASKRRQDVEAAMAGASSTPLASGAGVVEPDVVVEEHHEQRRNSAPATSSVWRQRPRSAFQPAPATAATTGEPLP